LEELPQWLGMDSKPGISKGAQKNTSDQDEKPIFFKKPWLKKE